MQISAFITILENWVGRSYSAENYIVEFVDSLGGWDFSIPFPWSACVDWEYIICCVFLALFSYWCLRGLFRLLETIFGG